MDLIYVLFELLYTKLVCVLSVIVSIVTSIHSQLKAKVLWVDRGEKQVGLTLKVPTVTGEQYLTEDMVMGTIIDEARVVHQDKNKALMLDLGNGHLGFSPVCGVQPLFIYMLLLMLLFIT